MISVLQRQHNMGRTLAVHNSYAQKAAPTGSGRLLQSRVSDSASDSSMFAGMRLLIALFCALFTFCSLLPAYAEEPKAADLVQDNQPIDLKSERYQLLFSELEAVHGFRQEELIPLFQGLTINRKSLELMDKQWEAKPYYEYRPLFVTPAVVVKGRESLAEHRELFDRIEHRFGVNREVIVAIWAIESRFGANQGNFELFRTLNTLFDAYPRRSDFFRKELVNYLLLCRANDIDPMSVHGSYAGAFGQAQFMPSSFNAYAVNFDDDQRIDLVNSLPDIFASIANYLSHFGWVLDAPVFAEIGRELKDDALENVMAQGRKGAIDWRQLAHIQDVDLPRPPREATLAITGLEVSPFSGGGMRYIACYPNFCAITEYNHSSKYAMAAAELMMAFREGREQVPPAIHSQQ